MSTQRPDSLPGDEPVATGDRRDEVHFEPDRDQLVVARHVAKPTGPLTPEMSEPGAEAAAAADSPPIEDVAVPRDGPSVWDARPPADDAGESGDPTAH